MDFRYRHRTFSINGVTRQDHIYKEITRKGAFYEMDLLEYLYTLRSIFQGEDSISIDVGANIGNHSVFFRSFLTDHVIPVEPNPQVLPVLTANLECNIDHFTVYPVALGANAGRGKIFFSEESAGDVGMGQIERENGANSIEIITLDHMVDDWRREHQSGGRIALIKIDVEGMELEVLRGARRTIEENRPHLLLEARTEDDYHRLRDHLAEFGYTDLSHWTSTPVYHFCHQPSGWLRARVLLASLKALLLERFIRRVVRIARRLLSR